MTATTLAVATLSTAGPATHAVSTSAASTSPLSASAVSTSAVSTSALSTSALTTGAPVVAAVLVGLAVLVLLGGRRAPDAPSSGLADHLRNPKATHPVVSEVCPSIPRRLGRWARQRSRGPSGDANGGPRTSDAEVASALALLALAYRSGLPTWDVLSTVAAGLGGPAADDLRRVAAALRWGASDSEAWSSVGPTWAPAARALAVAHQAGVPPSPMLLAAADDLRGAELERLEVSAAKVGVRLVAPLGLVLLPAFCLTTVAPLVIALAGDVLASRA